MADWITHITESLGYWGIALLMFLENIFPPIPSEVVMPLAGFSTSQGELSFAGVVAAGAAGSLAGVAPWYFLARWLGEERLGRWTDRYGRWLTVNGEDIRRSNTWFSRWGGWAVLIGRLVPAVRTLISVPAGLAKMPFGKFLAYSAIGTLAWTALLAWLGRLLGENYELVDKYIGWVSLAVIGGFVVWWASRLAKRRGPLSERSQPGSSS